MKIKSYVRKSLKAIFLCSLSFSLLPVAAYSDDVTTNVFLWSTTYDSKLQQCTDSYGLSYDDGYDSISFNSRPEILAPSSTINLRVSFSQECYGTSDKYTRTLSLIVPDGSVIPLQKNKSLSRTTEFKYSTSCQSVVCWYHVDVYSLKLSSQLPSGGYGVRFDTAYFRSVCTYENGASVCQRNVPTNKSFDRSNLFTLVQTGIPAPWEAGKPESGTTPAVKEAPVTKLPSAEQKTLPQFQSSSIRLTNKQKQIILSLVESNPDADKFICTGVRYIIQNSDFNLLVRKRAKAACDYAATLNPNLSTWVQSKVTLAENFAGRVLVTIKTPAG